MRSLPALLVLLACLAERAAANASSRRDAPPASFTAAPANLSEYQRGAVIRTREIGPPDGEVPPNFLQAYQVLLRSEDNRNKPIAAIATLLVPKQPRTTNGTGRAHLPTIFSHQAMQDSVSTSCAPSAVFGTPDGQDVALQERSSIIEDSISAGFYFVMSDYEGPQSSFGVGRQVGKIVLDAVRAAIEFQRLPAKAQVALYGYSGGGHATAWASSMAASYAPELNIVGAAYGGAPLDQESLIRHTTAGPFAAYAAISLVGMASKHPWVQEALIRVKGLQDATLLDFLSRSGSCTTAILNDFHGIDVLDFFEGGSPLAKWRVKHVLRRETLLRSKASFEVPVPKFPRFIFHGRQDEIALFDDVDSYVEEQCKRGANIIFATYKGGPVKGLPVHTTVLVGVSRWAFAALAFYATGQGLRVNGQPLHVPCGSAPPLFEGTPPLDEAFGPHRLSQLAG